MLYGELSLTVGVRFSGNPINLFASRMMWILSVEHWKGHRPVDPKHEAAKLRRTGGGVEDKVHARKWSPGRAERGRASRSTGIRSNQMYHVRNAHYTGSPLQT